VIFYGLYLLYLTNQRTSLLHAIIPSKKRYFINSNIDAYVKNKLLITGIVLITLGICWFLIKDRITIDEHVKTIILLFLLFEGLFNIVIGFWMLPATELRFTDTDVTLLRDSQVFRKIHNMTDFEISDDKIRIFRPDKSLEIGELTLKEDQKKVLSEAFEILKNKIRTIRKNTRHLESVYKERRKRYFRFKI
jgi:hypothetical protein